MPGSPLEPYLAWIWEQRDRGISWPQIGNALSEKLGRSIGGKRVEAYAKYNRHRTALPAPTPDRPPDPPPPLTAKIPGTVRPSASYTKAPATTSVRSASVVTSVGPGTTSYRGASGAVPLPHPIRNDPQMTAM